MTLIDLLGESLSRARSGPQGPVWLWLLAPAGAVLLVVAGPLGLWPGLAALLAGLPWFFRSPFSNDEIGPAWTAPFRLAVSLLLVSLLLAFFAIVVLLATALGALAVMAGTGFDFEAASAGQEAWDGALAAYRSTPGWQMVLGLAGVAGLAFLIAIVRFLPVFSASVREGRIVAMEVINWTRGHGVRLLFATLAMVALPLGLAVWLRATLDGAASVLAPAPFLLVGVYGVCCLSDAAYALLRANKVTSDTNS